VSQPVMESIYRQFFDEPRFRPSVIAAQRKAGGLLGRKSGEGFYRHDGGRQQTPPEAPVPPVTGAAPFERVWIAPGPHAAALSQLVTELGAELDDTMHPRESSLALIAPLGFDATTVAVTDGLPPENTVAIDTLFPFAAQACKRRVLMATPATSPDMMLGAHQLFAADGAAVSVLRDSPGFVAQRILAMVVAVACEIAQQRIASPADIDLAVRLGLGYPVGPLTMGDRMGPAAVAAILEGMAATTGDPRYRPSLWLDRRARLGLSLLHED
jgi:3-hydroxybutyryl-CoA dehydrogenase